MKLASLFCDHAVVQRGIPVPVWGWGKPLVRVKARLGRNEAESMAGVDGKFLIRLSPMPAGGPYDLEVTAEDGGGTVVARDVWVGEVWLASGQSNMDFTMSGINGPAGEAELKGAGIPGLRMITIPPVAYLGRQSDVPAEWKVSTPGAAMAFSAVAYHFAKRLRDKQTDVRMLSRPFDIESDKALKSAGDKAEALTDAPAFSLRIARPL